MGTIVVRRAIAWFRLNPTCGYSQWDTEKHLNDGFTDTLVVFNVDSGNHYSIKTGDVNCR